MGFEIVSQVDGLLSQLYDHSKNFVSIADIKPYEKILTARGQSPKVSSGDSKSFFGWPLQAISRCWDDIFSDWDANAKRNLRWLQTEPRQTFCVVMKLLDASLEASCEQLSEAILALKNLSKLLIPAQKGIENLEETYATRTPVAKQLKECVKGELYVLRDVIENALIGLEYQKSKQYIFAKSLTERVQWAVDLALVRERPQTSLLEILNSKHIDAELVEVTDKEQKSSVYAPKQATLDLTRIAKISLLFDNKKIEINNASHTDTGKYLFELCKTLPHYIAKEKFTRLSLLMTQAGIADSTNTINAIFTSILGPNISVAGGKQSISLEIKNDDNNASTLHLNNVLDYTVTSAADYSTHKVLATRTIIIPLALIPANPKIKIPDRALKDIKVIDKISDC